MLYQNIQRKITKDYYCEGPRSRRTSRTCTALGLHHCRSTSRSLCGVARKDVHGAPPSAEVVQHRGCVLREPRVRLVEVLKIRLGLYDDLCSDTLSETGADLHGVQLEHEEPADEALLLREVRAALGMPDVTEVAVPSLPAARLAELVVAGPAGASGVQLGALGRQVIELH